MLGKKLKISIPLVVETAGGQKVSKIANTWMHHVDWTLEQQWQDYKNMAIAWGRSNRNRNGDYLNIGKSGEVIRMGDGLLKYCA